MQFNNTWKRCKPEGVTDLGARAGSKGAARLTLKAEGGSGRAEILPSAPEGTGTGQAVTGRPDNCKPTGAGTAPQTC